MGRHATSQSDCAPRRPRGPCAAANRSASPASAPAGGEQQARRTQPERFPVRARVERDVDEAHRGEQVVDLRAGEHVVQCGHRHLLDAPAEAVAADQAAVGDVVLGGGGHADVAHVHGAVLPGEPGQDGFGGRAEVDHQPPAGPDRRGQRGDERPRALGIEVAEAVAHADGGVEAVGRDFAHLGEAEVDVDARRLRRAPGVLDRFGGDVEAGHGVAALGERDRMPPAAARDVDDARAGREPEPFLDEVDLGRGGLRRHGAPPELVGKFGEEVRVPRGRDVLGQRRCSCRCIGMMTMAPGMQDRPRSAAPSAAARCVEPGGHGVLQDERRMSAHEHGNSPPSDLHPTSPDCRHSRSCPCRHPSRQLSTRAWPGTTR